MNAPSENENWLIDIGDAIIRKKAAHGAGSLSSPGRLIYCLWVADYGMRNAGDLETAKDVYAGFQEEAKRLAAELRLPFTSETFSLPSASLEHEYLDRFERMCDEIRKA